MFVHASAHLFACSPLLFCSIAQVDIERSYFVMQDRVSFADSGTPPLATLIDLGSARLCATVAGAGRETKLQRLVADAGLGRNLEEANKWNAAYAWPQLAPR